MYGLKMRFGGFPGANESGSAVPALPAAINPEQNGLSEGETLERMEGTEPYASEVYKIRKDGATVGIRKIARNAAGAILGFTKKEKAFYDNIMKDPEYKNYIIPYRRGNQNASSAYINFNWVDGSDLVNYVNNNRATLTYVAKRDIVFQAAKALRWLAGKDRIHQDIKADNLYRRNSDGKILLIDFGLVTRLEFASPAAVELEITNFRNFLRALELPETPPPFDIENYSSASERIIAFYDKMIHDFAPVHEGGRHRRRTTRRSKRKQRRQQTRRSHFWRNV